MLPCPRHAALALALVAGLAVPGAGFGAPREDEAKRELESVERARERSESRRKALEEQGEKLEREIEEVRADMIGTARRIQQHEESVSSLEGEIRTLNRQERAARDNLLRRRNQMIGTLAALERLAGRPPEAMLAMPVSPVDTVRSALLMRAA